MYGYIYLNIIPGSGRVGYIGQHKYPKPELDPNYHGSSQNKDYYDDIKKYGKPLEFLIDVADTAEELSELECYWISKCDSIAPNGYNIHEGGGKGWSGLYNLKYSDPERYKSIMRKRSEYMKERNKWIPHTPPPNDNWKKNYDRMYRLIFTESTKLKLSRAVMDLWKDPEYRSRQSLAHRGPRLDLRGRKASDATKKKLSESHKGQKPWNTGMTNMPYKPRMRYIYEKPNGDRIEMSQPKKVKRLPPDWKYIGPADHGITE